MTPHLRNADRFEAEASKTLAPVLFRRNSDNLAASPYTNEDRRLVQHPVSNAIVKEVHVTLPVPHATTGFNPSQK